MDETIFQKLNNIINEQHRLIKDIADKLQDLDIHSGGGGGGTGNAVIEDYEAGKTYVRNTLVVDTATETVYRVIPTSYVAVSVAVDKGNGDLKIVGFESSIVTFNHNPRQSEIDVLPDDTLVAVYSPSDSPYIPDNE